jgi:chemotaxis protein CheX
MDTANLRPFVSALRHVFDVAFQMNVMTTHALSEPVAGVAPDVAARVFVGHPVNAALSLEFSLPTARRLVGLFAGRDVHEQTDADVRDAIGEIASMVAGNAKAHFGASRIRTSIPRVDLGHAMPVRVGDDGGIGITCVSDCGDFVLRLVPPRPRATVTTRSLTEALKR